MLEQVAHYGSAPNHTVVMVMARGMQICWIDQKTKTLVVQCLFLGQEKDPWPFGTTEGEKKKSCFLVWFEEAAFHMRKLWVELARTSQSTGDRRRVTGDTVLLGQREWWAAFNSTCWNEARFNSSNPPTTHACSLQKTLHGESIENKQSNAHIVVKLGS